MNDVAQSIRHKSIDEENEIVWCVHHHGPIPYNGVMYINGHIYYSICEYIAPFSRLDSFSFSFSFSFHATHPTGSSYQLAVDGRLARDDEDADEGVETQ